jgi:hypothetical protein
MGLNLKKFFLHLLIGSVSISAVIGIVVILLGDFGELESKILLTTTSVTATSILGLACGAYLETGRDRVLPIAGIGFSVLAAILWIILIWGAFRNEEIYIKISGSSALLAVACSHLSLISLARLDQKYIWSRFTLYSCVWLLVAILLWLIWFDPTNPSDLVLRTNGVLSIIIAALTITTPIFHKLSQSASEEKEIDEEIGKLKERLAELEQRKAELHKQGAGE